MHGVHHVFAALGRHDVCITLCRAVKCLVDRGGSAVQIRPMSSISTLAQTIDASKDLGLAVADLTGWDGASPTEKASEEKAFRAMVNGPSAPIVLVFMPHQRREPVLDLARWGVREVLVEGEEDSPATLALVLCRLLLPPAVGTFLDGFPGIGLHPDYLLGLVWGVLRPTVEFNEAALAGRAGRDRSRMEDDFARAGAPEPRQACVGATIFGLATERGAGQTCFREWLESAGIRDRSDLLRYCDGVLPGDLLRLVDEGDPMEVLECLRHAERRSRSFGRPFKMPPPDPERRRNLAALYEKHQGLLLDLAIRRGVSEDDACDIVHDIFASIIARDANRELSERYLVSAMLNRLRDHHRRKARWKRLLRPLEGPSVVASPDACHDIDESRRRSVLHAVVRGLNGSYPYSDL
jgi:hypothetical protein